MKREIYEVYAKVIDSNGAYNTLSGYPKAFDSNQYNDDIEKARKRAYGEYHEVLGAMCKRDDRQAQIAMIIRGSDGIQMEKTYMGAIADLPDPTYTLTVVNGSGSGDYTEGARVVAVANDPEEGKKFSVWTGLSDSLILSGDIVTSRVVFKMPAEALEIEATYEDLPEPEPEPEPTPEPEPEPENPEVDPEQEPDNGEGE